MTADDHEHRSTTPGYETRDVSLWKIAGYTLIAIVLLVVVVVFIMDYFVGTREELVEEMVLSPASTELRELRTREAEELGTYGLLDSASGTYRIPIDRAMQQVADEAFRTRQNRTGVVR